MSPTTIEAITASAEQRQSDSFQIADKLRHAIETGELPAGTKLQSESKLSKAFGTTVHTIRKALHQLRESGHVYSLPKQGVFVREQLHSSITELTQDCCTSTCLHFATLSNLRRHSDIFNPVIGAFRESPPFYDLKCIDPGEDFDLASLGEGAVDVVENSSPIHYPKNRHLFLDIRKYFSESLKTSAKDCHAVPFCYSTTYLCYHPDLLSKIGCESPAWKTFQEQNDYLEEATQRLQAHDMMMPGTHFSSLELLDHYGSAIMDDFSRHDLSADEFVGKYADQVRTCTAYWSHYRISAPGKAMQHTEEFIQRKTPFLFTNASHVIALQENHPDLHVAFYPILGIEGRLPRVTVPLSIVKTTPYLAESVRFIQSLQTKQVQKQLAASGYIPMDETCYESLPKAAANFPVATERFFVTPEEFYTGINILNVELWNIVLLHKNVEEALKNALILARAYLDFQTDLKAQRLQQDRGKLYIS